MFRRSKASLPSPDFILLALAGALILFGVIVLASASGVVAYNKFGDSFFYVKRQIAFGLIPGVILFLVGMKTPYTFWRRMAFPFFIFSLALLSLVFISGIGATYGHARSWLNIGGFSLQPAEIAKVTLLFYLAAWFEKKSGLIPFLLMIGALGALIMAQPDIGTMGLIVAMAVVVYFVSGAPWWHVGLLFIGGVGLFGAVIAMAPYRLARVLTFLTPERDPTGASYQLIQSLVAIGSGGLFGVGLGASRQKLQYLPEVAADSIFSIIAEELGFFVVMLFLAVFLAFVYRGLHIAREAPDQFARLFTTGVFTWFSLQAFFNIASMIGLLPLTGLPLPLVSYGGTALATSLFALGIVANISRYTRTL